MWNMEQTRLLIVAQKVDYIHVFLSQIHTVLGSAFYHFESYSGLEEKNSRSILLSFRASSNRNGQKNRKIGIRAPKK